MKRKRFSEEQIITILRQIESGLPIPEACRQHGISDQTIYRWRAKFGGMDASEAKRLRGRLAIASEEGARRKRLSYRRAAKTFEHKPVGQTAGFEPATPSVER